MCRKTQYKNICSSQLYAYFYQSNQSPWKLFFEYWKNYSKVYVAVYCFLKGK